MPTANKFQLHIYAALAEEEREMISIRTKAALQAAKARGVKLSGSRGGSTVQARAAAAALADERARKAIDLIGPLRKPGLSLALIATRLNVRGWRRPGTAGGTPKRSAG
jgi:DNA invertase Pin-like site-specific DNA recombinase